MARLLTMSLVIFVAWSFMLLVLLPDFALVLAIARDLEISMTAACTVAATVLAESTARFILPVVAMLLQVGL